MTRQEIEILLHLVRERRTYVVKHTQAPQPVREAEAEAALAQMKAGAP